MPPRPNGKPLRVRDFMTLVLERATELVPPELRDLNARIRFVWLQIHYWTPKIHYEVWLTRKTNRIEIGLHFEGERDFSYRWAEVMAARMLEVQARLGPHVELEEWTPSWTRIHQTVPYDPLTEELAGDVAGRLARTIAVLQPIVEEERKNVPARLEALTPVKRPGRSRFQRRRSRRGPAG